MFDCSYKLRYVIICVLLTETRNRGEVFTWSYLHPF